MRAILSLALALSVVSGTALMTGCNSKKAETKHEEKDISKTPGGGKTETEKKVTTETTPPKDEKK